MDTAQVIEFITRHPWLISVFLLASLTLLVIEIRNKSRFAISPQKLVEYVNYDRAVIWDIRSQKDFDQGHITAAKHVLTDNLNKETIKNHKAAIPLILVCNNGIQSAGYLKKLAKFHNKIFYLHGGIAEWQNQRLPLVKS